MWYTLSPACKEQLEFPESWLSGLNLLGKIASQLLGCCWGCLAPCRLIPPPPLSPINFLTPPPPPQKKKQKKKTLGILLEYCIFLVSRPQGKAKDVSVNAERLGGKKRECMYVCMHVCIYMYVCQGFYIVFTHE